MKKHLHRGALPLSFIQFDLRRIFIGSIAVGLAILLQSSIRNAVAEDPDSLAEIVINADPEKRSVNEIPSSVSVLTQDNFQNQGSEAFQQNISMLPNLNFAGGTATPRFFQIRGIGELEQYEGAPNYSVGYFIDDIDLSGIGSAANTFDIDQIEVLRGPQGIAYGANALAGLIHLSSPTLSATDSGKGKFSLGSDDLVNGGLALGGALTKDKKNLYRISVFQEQQNGFYQNDFRNGDHTNDRENFKGSLSVSHEFDNGDTLLMSLLRLDTNNGYDAFSIDNSRHTQSDRPGKDDIGVTGASARYTSNLLKDMTLTLISSYTSAKQDYSFDGDWGNNAFWGPYAPYDYFFSSFRDRDQFSQQIRLSDENAEYKIGETSRYIIGAYGQRFFEKTTNQNFQDGSAYDILDSSYSATTSAVYGQRETPLFDDTALTTGLRVEKKQASYLDSRDTEANPDDTMLGLNASVSHEFQKDLLGYALVSRGYRAGGVNTGISVPADRRVFSDESLWNYEVGVKGKFPSIKTTSNLSLFIQRSKDAQVKGAYQLDPTDPLTFTYITDNAASGSSAGVEWEVQSHITDHLQMVGQLSLLQTELDANTPGLLQNRARSHAPSWGYGLTPRYYVDDNWFAEVQFTGKGSFYYDDSFNQRSQPYTLVNPGIGYQKDSIQVLAWARNIFDKDYTVRGFYFGVEPPDYPNKLYTQQGDPLSFGVTVSYQF